MKLEDSPFGITLATTIGIRLKPDHTSELLSQLLFGESFQIEESTAGWLRIKTIPTLLEGWIPGLSVEGLEQPGPTAGDPDAQVNLQTLSVTCPSQSNYPYTILPGSTLPVPPSMGGRFTLGSKLFRFETPVPDEAIDEAKSNIEALSLIFINAPHLWGGRSLFGIDSTGLIQLVYKMRGINLPRSFQELIRLGEPVPFANDAQPGDLAFFEDESGSIIHAGIITQPGKIVHVHGRAREDFLDHAGIYSKKDEKYIFFLRLINRIV